jgi:nitric oxide reductase NorQ protein
MPNSRGLTANLPAPVVRTEFFRSVCDRALSYLQANVPVHLQGPSGTGKTTCALYLAHKLERPVVLMFGNDHVAHTDLVGHHFGLHRRVLVDNYVRYVERREEEVTIDWVDGRLLTACKEGCTLVYDEFSRSRPETNNILLSVLGEGVLELPPTYPGEKTVKVHPDFRVILTSNPDEYAGVHRRPNALMDRIITIDLSNMDDASVIAITQARTGLSEAEASTIVATVRRMGYHNRQGHSVRAALMIAQILKTTGQPAEPGNPFFDQLCEDVLGSVQSQRRHAEQTAEIRRSRRREKSDI